MVLSDMECLSDRIDGAGAAAADRAAHAIIIDEITFFIGPWNDWRLMRGRVRAFSTDTTAALPPQHQKFTAHSRPMPGLAPRASWMRAGEKSTERSGDISK